MICNVAAHVLRYISDGI